MAADTAEPAALDHAVAVVPAPPRRLRRAVEQALRQVGWREVLGAEQRVLVKPNLGFDLYRPGAVTSAAVLEAVVEVMLAAGHEVVIIEADQVLVDIEAAARTAGVPALCGRPGISWLNLSERPYEARPVPGARCLDPMELPAIIGRHPLVTVPVMKTHSKTTISGALKNQWGLLPLDRHRHHPRVNDVLQDLLQAARPALCLMDATVCMEGSGPKAGEPRRLDLLLAARDPLRMDWLAAALMGFDPAAIEHLRLAAPAGFRGLRDIQLLGELPRVRPFKPARHNVVSLVETALRSHGALSWVFDSPLFPVLCGGARAWYQLWYRCLASRDDQAHDRSQQPQDSGG